jgi:hypothetical protein
MQHTVAEGFLSATQLEGLRAGQDAGVLLDELETLSRQSAGQEDYRRI